MPSGATRLPRDWPAAGFDFRGPSHTGAQRIIWIGKFHDDGDVVGEFLPEPP